MIIFDWLRKQMGYHVCEEFTQWKTMIHRYSRLAVPKEVMFNNVTTVEFTKRTQERQCTICGKIQQRKLD